MGRIALDNTLPPSGRTETLLHELIHCVNKVYLNGNLGEDVVSALAEGLNQVLPQLGIEFDWSELESEE